MGQDGFVEAHDAWETGLARSESGQQVFADLGFDGAMNVAALSQLAKNTRLMHGNETTSLRDDAGRVSHLAEISDLDY
jgi:tRNA(Leu) C34 or U34 (ribose-2'-O)-methylase TrmL